MNDCMIMVLVWCKGRNGMRFLRLDMCMSVCLFYRLGVSMFSCTLALIFVYNVALYRQTREEINISGARFVEFLSLDLSGQPCFFSRAAPGQRRRYTKPAASCWPRAIV